MKYPKDTVIVSGLPDFLTGVYHSTELARLAGVKNNCFSMGSHFVLIEWPSLVAKLLYEQIVEEKSDPACCNDQAM